MINIRGHTNETDRASLCSSYHPHGSQRQKQFEMAITTQMQDAGVQYATREQVRIYHSKPTLTFDDPPRHTFSHSDLVLDLDFPRLVLPTDHYTDDNRFFAYVNRIAKMTSNGVYTPCSHRMELPGQFYASNIYASYEVDHWNNVERQIMWTKWVMDTINCVARNESIKPCPKIARSLLSQALRDGINGFSCWFFDVFPGLIEQGLDAYMAYKVGRDPTGLYVEESDSTDGFAIVRTDLTVERDEYEPVEFRKMLRRSMCLTRPHFNAYLRTRADWNVRIILKCCSNVKELPRSLRTAKVPFDEDGYYAPVPPTQQQGDLTRFGTLKASAEGSTDGGDDRSETTDTNDAGGCKSKAYTDGNIIAPPALLIRSTSRSSPTTRDVPTNEHPMHRPGTAQHAIAQQLLYRTPSRPLTPVKPNSASNSTSHDALNHRSTTRSHPSPSSTIPDPNLFSTPAPPTLTPGTAQHAITQMSSPTTGLPYGVRTRQQHLAQPSPQPHLFRSPSQIPLNQPPPRTFGDVFQGQPLARPQSATLQPLPSAQVSGMRLTEEVALPATEHSSTHPSPPIPHSQAAAPFSNNVHTPQNIPDALVDPQLLAMDGTHSIAAQSEVLRSEVAQANQAERDKHWEEAEVGVLGDA